MVKLRLLDFVILGGFGTFSTVAWDHARNEGRVFRRVQDFCNEVHQSVFKGVEKNKVDDDKAPESTNDDQEKSSGNTSELVTGPDAIQNDSFTTEASKLGDETSAGNVEPDEEPVGWWHQKVEEDEYAVLNYCSCINF